MLCYSAIDACAMQAHRLDCDGNVLTGPTDVVVSCANTSTVATPIAGEATESRDPNGSGGYCAERSNQASVEGMTVELTLCSRTDAELMELLGIWDLIYAADGTTVVGVKSKCCSQEVCNCSPADGCHNPGVALMTWSNAWLGKNPHPDFTHVVQIFPRIKFDPTSVAVTRNNEFQIYTLTGTSDCNDSFGQGPGLIVPDANGLSECWGELLTNQRPDGICGCEVCGYATTGFVGAS